jgi:hypothetical protein
MLTYLLYFVVFYLISISLPLLLLSYPPSYNLYPPGLTRRVPSRYTELHSCGTDPVPSRGRARRRTSRR